MQYSQRQIVLHWISVLLILVMAGTGMAYSLEWADKAAMTWHQIAGQLLLVTLLARLFVRFTTRTDHSTTPYSALESRASQAVHTTLYVILVAYVVTGYVSASALGQNSLLAPVSIVFARSDIGETLLELHYALKWVLLALVAVHIAGALKHLIWDRHTGLSNMFLHSKP